MKKKVSFLIILCLLFVPNIIYGAMGQNEISYSDCKKAVTSVLTRSGEYTQCLRAHCQSGTWSVVNLFSDVGSIACYNGNSNPYKVVSSDGCSIYSGSCSVANQHFCTRVSTIDCNRNADGSTYVATTFGNATSNSPVATRATQSGNNVTTKQVTNATNNTIVTKKRTNGTTKVIIERTEATRQGETKRSVVTTESTEETSSLSSNTKIKKLLFENTELPDFSDKTYQLEISTDMTDVDVVCEPEDSNATCEVTGNTGLTGENAEINVTVTAADGTSKTRTIKVHRSEGDSSDCTAANITIDNYDNFTDNFDKNNYEYNLRVGRNTNSLNIEVVPSDLLHAEIEVKGYDNIQNNSVVTVNIKAADGTLCTYNIHIKKSSGLWIIILIILIVIAILVTIIYFVRKNLTRSKNLYKYE